MEINIGDTALVVLIVGCFVFALFGGACVGFTVYICRKKYRLDYDKDIENKKNGRPTDGFSDPYKMNEYGGRPYDRHNLKDPRDKNIEPNDYSRRKEGPPPYPYASPENRRNFRRSRSLDNLSSGPGPYRDWRELPSDRHSDPYRDFGNRDRGYREDGYDDRSRGQRYVPDGRSPPDWVDKAIEFGRPDPYSSPSGAASDTRANRIQPGPSGDRRRDDFERTVEESNRVMSQTYLPPGRTGRY